MAINFIGLEPQGNFKKEEDLEEYYMSSNELSLLKEGKIAVIGTVTYYYGKDGSYREHDNTVCNMTQAVSIDIFYDIEDDYMMDQTITFADGQSVYGRSRNHEEVRKWEALGIPITKSYGY